MATVCLGANTQAVGWRLSGFFTITARTADQQPIEVSVMRSFIRSALLGAAGLVALSLSAHAVGSTAVTDTPLFKSTTTTMPMQLAFGGMYKQSQSTKAKKAKKKK
jgi:hypothetical protein